MAKSNLLNALSCRNIKKSGMHADGNGLFLSVSATGGKSWIFRYRWQGKRPEIGLGSYPDVSLSDARERMADCRKLIRKGIDPRSRNKETGEQPSTPTFAECGAQFIRDKQTEWKNPKHQAQWTSTLET